MPERKRNRDRGKRRRKKWKLSEKDFQMNGNSFKSYLPLFSCDSADARRMKPDCWSQSLINKTTNANVNWTSTVAAAEVAQRERE